MPQAMQNNPNDPAAPLLEAGAGFRKTLTTVFAAFLVWLIGDSLVTALSPEMTPAIQASMFSHRDIGIVFSAFLCLYLPLHIVAARGLSLKALDAVVAPLKFLFLLIALYLAMTFAWELNRYLALPVLGAAFAAFELTRKRRSVFLRALDTLLLALVVAFVLTSTRDGLIRLFVLTLGASCTAAMAVLFVNLFRRGRPDPSGRLLVTAGIFLTLFSLMMVGGTNSGKYNRFLPVMDNFHYASSFAFVLITLIHVKKVSRRYPALRPLPRLVNLPLLAALALGLGAWELINIHRYEKFAAPVVRTSGIKPRRVSEYTQLEGYILNGRDDWFVRPAQTCGTPRCHPELVEQHALSAHGRAFDNQVFKLQLKTFVAEKGREAADYCLACHAPLGVIAYPGNSPRARDIDLFTTKDPAFQLGVDCIVCHRARPDTNRATLGNASLSILPLWMDQERYLGEEPGDARGFEIHRQLIHAANRLHKKTWHIPKQDWNAVCASCHVVKLPAQLSCGGAEVTVADQFSSFMDSPYGKAGLTCAACHQQRFATYEISYNTVSHNYLGSGTSLPYPDKSNDTRFRDISVGFLRGLGDITLQTPEKQLPPCLDTIEQYMAQYIMLPQRGARNPFKGTNGGVTCRFLLDTGITVDRISGNTAQVRVQTMNKCGGHTFPSGGGLKAYLEIKAYDARGNVVGKYGGRDKSGRPLALETTLGSRSHDAHGEPITDRSFWRFCGLIYKKRLAPGERMSNTVMLPLKPGAKPAKITATWYYLRPEYFRNLERGLRDNVAPVEIGKATINIPGRGRSGK